LQPDLKATPKPPPIVRIELVRLDLAGKLSLLPADSLTIPVAKRQPLPLPLMAMEGLPTFETSLFVSFPSDQVRLGQTWSVPEWKRPAINFRIDGLDSVRGGRCFKIVAKQQTDDWETPSRDAAPWRRVETILVSAKNGYAARLERTIEKRDPQTGDLAFRSRLECDQLGSMRYSDRFGEDRRAEIAAALQFTAEFERLLPQAGRGGEQPFDALLQRIDQFLSSHLASEAVPFREATICLKRKVEGAKRGYIPPAPPSPETNDTTVVRSGKPTPELATTDLTSGRAVNLTMLRGRPVVLLWYQPNSVRTAEPVLRFAQSLYDRYGDRAFILPLAIGDDAAAVKQRNDLNLAVHILAGRQVNKLHGVDSAPYFEVIGSDGIVKEVTVGWSDENAQSVREGLEKVLRP
jgi:hypothetical protein